MDHNSKAKKQLLAKAALERASSGSRCSTWPSTIEFFWGAMKKYLESTVIMFIPVSRRTFQMLSIQLILLPFRSGSIR